MFQTFKNAWKIEDLRKKILFTLMILVIFRLGAALPAPFVDAVALSKSTLTDSTTIFGFFDLMTGGSFSQATLFALSVTPYINASIIIQLLQVVIPALDRLAKEGEEGRNKINRITRYSAIGISLALACVYYFLLKRQSALIYTEGFAGVFSAIVIIACLTGGAVLLIWLGEQIDQKGIGSGISLLIFTGIISNLVKAFAQIKTYFQLAAGTYTANGTTYSAQPAYYVLVPLIIIMFAAMFVFIIVMTNAERRIPVQYAKRVVGRKMYGGQNTNIPIKVNMSGVLPVIFASAFLSVPATIKNFFGINEGGWATFLGWFETSGWLYAVLYALLIMGFNYFYVAIQYNPIEMANNLRKNSGTIPGIRPGKPTSEFIARVISKITFIGGLFLILVATLPIIITKTTGINISLGGTSVLIVVGVALEISNTLESYMLMRHHKGFLE
ncbi:MAG: preprotein translocase subunit SecY [Oscillospiraceae bacterium]|nr:preprotein translocase subunit SecY [Oscillospiraceae bacterium]